MPSFLVGIETNNNGTPVHIVVQMAEASALVTAWLSPGYARYIAAQLIAAAERVEEANRDMPPSKST